MENPRLQQVENVREQTVDLSRLTVHVVGEKTLNTYYEKKAAKTMDPEKWYKKNHRALENEKIFLEKMVTDGILSDLKPESLCRFIQGKIETEKADVKRLRIAIRQRSPEMLNAAASRLSEFIPPWNLDEGTVNFTLDDRADFRVDGTKITADMGRLTRAKDWFETTVEGIAHESFHIWMQEGDGWSDAEQESAPLSALINHIIFRTVDEGLAVLISRQKLKEHHEKAGRNYSAYIEESFQAFRDFLHQSKREIVNEIYVEAFENMGHFYVVGNEMAKALLDTLGGNEFRALIQTARQDPAKLIERYITSTPKPKLTTEDMTFLKR